MRTLSRILICQLILLFVVNSKANPILIEYPQVFISELSFNAGNNWTLELEVFCNPPFPLPGSIDSVVIQTNSGTSRLLNFSLVNNSLSLITNSELSRPLVINQTQDTIRILTYLNEQIVHPWFGNPLIHQLVYGYPDCEIPVLISGQSICSWEINYGYPLCFYKDNSPTLGLPNDTIGATAELHGMFYDYQNRLITSPIFYYVFCLSNNVTSYYNSLYQTTYYQSLAEFKFDVSGSYSTKVLSGKRNVAFIDNLYDGGCPFGYPSCNGLSCENFQFNLEPGQFLEQNIKLTDTSFKVGLKELHPTYQGGLTVVCAPNPFSTYFDFFLSSVKVIKEADIRIFDTKGQQVKLIRIDCNTNSWSERVNKDELGSAGIYCYSIIENGKKIKSGQIICQ